MVRYGSRPALFAVLASVMLLTTGTAGVAVAGMSATTVAQTADSSAETPDGAEVIDSFTSRLSSLDTVQFTRVSETELNNDTHSQKEHVVADLADFQSRTETVGADSTYGSNTTTVTNESMSITYNADENTVSRFESEREILLPRLERLANESAVDYEYAGTDTVDGREVCVLELTPAEQPDIDVETSVTLYVDSETYFPVQAVSTVESEEYSSTTTMNYKNVTLNEEIPDSTFELDVPEDASEPSTNAGPDISQYDSHESLRSNTTLTVPDAKLDDGYEFHSAQIIDGENYYSVSTRYTDGNAWISISLRNETVGSFSDHDEYEEVTVGSDTGWYVEYGEHGFLHWESGGQSYTLSGDLSKEEILDVATSVTSSPR